MGLKILGKEFAIKTLITVGMQSMFLVVVPIPAVPLIEDYLTACIIGGIIAGTEQACAKRKKFRRRTGYYRALLL